MKNSHRAIILVSLFCGTTAFTSCVALTLLERTRMIGTFVSGKSMLLLGFLCMIGALSMLAQAYMIYTWMIEESPKAVEEGRGP